MRLSAALQTETLAGYFFLRCGYERSSAVSTICRVAALEKKKEKKACLIKSTYHLNFTYLNSQHCHSMTRHEDDTGQRLESSEAGMLKIRSESLFFIVDYVLLMFMP